MAGSALRPRQPMTPAQAFEASAAAERLQFEEADEFTPASQSTPSTFRLLSEAVGRNAERLANRARSLADKCRGGR